MTNLFYTYYKYIQIFSSFILFFYIYKYFFDKCNERVLIKNKGSKQKKYVIKSKITLSFLYFALILSLYFLMTIRVSITFILLISLGMLLLFNKFSPESLNCFNIFDKNKSVRFGWKIFYSFINLVLMILYPIHNEFSKESSKKYNYYKNKISEIFLNDKSSDSIDKHFINLFKNFNLFNNTSDISDYILSKKHENTKINIEKNNIENIVDNNFSNVKINKHKKIKKQESKINKEEAKEDEDEEDKEIKEE